MTRTVLCAATHGLPAAAKISQGVPPPPLDVPLDEPELPEDVVPLEPPDPPELPEEVKPPSSGTNAYVPQAAAAASSATHMSKTDGLFFIATAPVCMGHSIGVGATDYRSAVVAPLSFRQQFGEVTIVAPHPQNGGSAAP
jgi:hypothetical protein